MRFRCYTSASRPRPSTSWSASGSCGSTDISPSTSCSKRCGCCSKQSFVGDHFRERGGFDTGVVLEAWGELPPSVLKAQRNKREHLSNVLSRNEADRDYTYNRRLFKRLTHGCYQ